MNITVKLFASLRKGRFDLKNIRCEDNTTVGNICRELGIIENSLILLVNSKHADFNYSLSNGDVLAIFPLIGGG
jgi:sulfur-carrier protein